MESFGALGCEVLFTTERGRAVQELIEGATGELCPCKQGKVCPLLPEMGRVSMDASVAREIAYGPPMGTPLMRTA